MAVGTLPTWYRVQGDAQDFFDARLDGVDTLAGVTTVAGSVWRGSTVVALTGVVLDAEDRTVRLSLTGWLPTAALGVWQVEVTATWATGEVRTWPAQQPGRIVVRADAEPPTP